MHEKVQNKTYSQSAFTIVELLVVIVIIGILAAITIVSYSGVSYQARLVSVKSDLSNSLIKLESYRVEYGSYPTALDSNYCPTNPTVDSNYCIKPSAGNSFTYNYNSEKGTFGLTSYNNDIYYRIANNSPQVACAPGFVIVPGSATYGTNDFCVMKYEAKNNGSNVAVSKKEGLPWIDVTQNGAKTASSAICSGCHLITEAEWMTIAQNVLSVPSNWSGGAVGSGYIFSGNNDGVPGVSLAASSDDDGYSGTGNSSGQTAKTNSIEGNTQRRTLTLTNGEVIWDLSGNVFEWTDGQASTGKPGVNGGGFTYRDWVDLTNAGSLTINPFPGSTLITGASSWTTENGIGGNYVSSDDTTLRGFLRGGHESSNDLAGVLFLSLSFTPSDYGSNVGFWVAR